MDHRFDRFFDIPADDGIVGPTHPNIGQEGTVMDDGLIRRLDMRMCADDSSGILVEVFQEGRNMIVELSVDSFNDNVAVEGKIVYLPIYMTMFIQPPSLPEKLIYKIE